MNENAARMRFEARLDPELAHIVRALPDRSLDDIPAARAATAAMLAALPAIPDSPRVYKEDHLAPGRTGNPDVGVRVYRPIDKRGPLACLYWMHGGGYVSGSLEQDDPWLQRLVDVNGIAVVSVEWRLAPEHPYPASMEDCYAGLSWTTSNADRLGLDPDRIAIGGASSGGGSAAGLALLARDRSELRICYQLLAYPMLDDRNLTPSSHLITDRRVWNREKNLIAWRAYLGGIPGSDIPPYAAPSRAADLSGLPPAFIGVGELDLFVDEDVQYAQNLIQAQVPTELHVYNGAHHGFDRTAPLSSVAARFVRDRDDALRRAFGLR